MELQARPRVNRADEYLALTCSFSLLMLFICSIIYKYDALTASTDVQAKMSLEQKEDFVVSQLLLSAILLVSVIGSLVITAVLVAFQLAI